MRLFNRADESKLRLAQHVALEHPLREEPFRAFEVLFAIVFPVPEQKFLSSELDFGLYKQLDFKRAFRPFHADASRSFERVHYFCRQSSQLQRKSP
jgi:hypothetical protein